ncbi:MAG TPA: PHB depolymerase family esterase [Fibrobacteria bacterium]|nr:PHB depolymerase family esterase [Fibrobacteria bacterium]HOX50897.1 PHB depolymerase family esterase [Fibrobacteria bacterium]
MLAIQRTTTLFLLGGLLLAPRAQAVTLTEVPVATWKGSVNLPSYAKMYVYVPAKLAAKPPIVVSNHSCGSSAAGQAGNMGKFLAAADKNGFVMIFPDNPGQNCWDVGSKAALTRDGGGDPHAIATMVRYALKKYGGDSSRVYVVGGSSGAMMTQALLGVYPDLFAAGAPRAGVACGCWAESYAASNQWSGPCAGGNVTKTAQQWGDYVRAINPGYKGHRPRVQIYHGESDQTINFKNFGESLKEWTNVLELPTTPTTSGKVTTPSYTYNRQTWTNACGVAVLDAWSSPGQPHSMTYEEDTIIRFFGLQSPDSKDPEAACQSGTERIQPATRTVAHVRPDRTLVLEASDADEVSIAIRDLRGQFRMGAHRQVDATSEATIGLSGLRAGTYLGSATYFRSGRAFFGTEFSFVMVP